jgi:hypothetical protein
MYINNFFFYYVFKHIKHGCAESKNRWMTVLLSSETRTMDEKKPCIGHRAWRPEIALRYSTGGQVNGKSHRAESISCRSQAASYRNKSSFMEPAA